MRMSSAVQSSLLLLLMVGCFLAEAARFRITVRQNRANYRIDYWDDGREEPFRIISRKRRVRSVYTFEESGRLRTLTIDDTQYTFDSNTEAANGSPAVEASTTGSRMLLASEEFGALEEVHFDHRRLYECADCEETWDTLCSAGIVDVCSRVPLLPDIFDEDAQVSLTTMCTALGSACDTTSAFDTCEGQCIAGLAPEPTPAPVPAPTPAPTPAPVPEPTPAPIDTDIPADIPAEDACNPNPCENGGSCSLDPAGGHTCACTSGFGGMACQTDTSSLDAFFIEIDFIGVWTDARRAVFQSAADRWSEVITHVPCGGSSSIPAGRLLISATLEEIDGPGSVLGSAGPSLVWSGCRSISYLGSMRFDIADIVGLENRGIFEGVILHEMGHVIGVGTLWGVGFGNCATCRSTGDPTWMCPAAASTYVDIGGSGSGFLELDGGTGTRCGHLDEVIFQDELMTGFVNSIMFLSKMTAAVLDGLDYIVDPSAVDSYTLPSERGASIIAGSGPSIFMNDTAVDTMIYAMDGDGNVVGEIEGIVMVF